MNQNNKKDNSLVISYLNLRMFVGIIGIALPFVLAFGNMLFHGWGILSTVSDYYYSTMGDVFVGALCAIGVFLWSYRGYEKIDNIAGGIACVFAIGVALFPTYPANPSDLTPNSQMLSYIHYSCAAGLFLTLAFFSLYLFRLRKPGGETTPQKDNRNVVYAVCGVIILICIALIGIVFFFLEDSPINRLDPVFWLEAIAIVSFGFSWLVKGETILGDQ